MATETSYLGVTTPEELFGRAEIQAASAPSEYREIVRLYYIARYLVSLFESRDQALPIQVWNEYRNALDHFARHLTLSDDISREDKHRHLSKMEGHIQRAVLDISKFICIYFGDYYKEYVHRDRRALALVTNGEFLEGIQNIHSRAQDLFLRAKQQDSSLGEEAATNSQVVDSYCSAVFEFIKIEKLYRKNNAHIVRARGRYRLSQALSIVQQLAIGGIIALISGSVVYYIENLP